MIKHAQTLAGLLFFETQGVTSTIRYWVVAEKFRTLRYGSALMRAYFAAQAAIQRFNLWVIADNQPAILRYQHYGYASDKLVDHVLVNKMIRAMKTVAEILKEIRPEFDFASLQGFYCGRNA